MKGKVTQMKVIFDKGELLSALIPAAGLVPGHNTAAATDGILFECPGEDPGTCRISAYDMEKGVRTTIPAKIMDEGSFILNTQKILQIVPEHRVINFLQLLESFQHCP